jgi:hypothetical protein
MTEDTKVISIRDVRLQRAEVTLDTIKVGGKQVTLAIFRQLIEEDLIAKDGSFNGLPWGHVNYCPDKRCSDSNDHLHIVWQKGDQLRRTTVQREPYFQPYHSKTVTMYISARIRDIAIGRLPFPMPKLTYYYRDIERAKGGQDTFCISASMRT